MIASDPNEIIKAASGSLGVLRRQTESRLAACSDSPGLDAQVLLARILDRSQSWILAHPEYATDEHEQRILEASLRRLESGEPLPVVLGNWEFFSLDFYITSQVLIPRPETELLVEEALVWLAANPERRLAADVGTGSGCIAVSLASSIPDLQILACDISMGALQLARINARKHTLANRIYFVQSDLLETVGRPFDLICANLPYIPTRTLHALPVFGREPTLALDGGPDGLDLIRRQISKAAVLLSPDGLMLLEIEAAQGGAAQHLGQRAFPEAQIQVQKDLAGKDRLLRIER